MENYRQVLKAIQRSPYYVDVDENEWKVDRYSDKYNKNTTKPDLHTLYTYKVLSNYIPTGIFCFPSDIS